MMTPYEVEILMHFVVSRAPFPRKEAPLFESAVEGLIEADLLSQTAEKDIYTGTQKGRIHLEQICNLPLPRKAWIDNEGNIINAKQTD